MELKAGASVRVYCEDCQTEYDIVHEPKAKENPKEAQGMEAKTLEKDTLHQCLFCLSTNVTIENEEEGEGEPG
jgi:hypothetical protein